jgi:hypothetical protein
MGFGMKSGWLAGLMAAFVLAACASSGLPIESATANLPRPPQGKGPAGTDFGYWRRDAEGAVDSAFRGFILARYNASDALAARKDFETDGFKCRDGNRPEARPVPTLECSRLYKLNEDVHAWTVEFWPSDAEPRARYTRTHIRDPSVDYDEDRR